MFIQFVHTDLGCFFLQKQRCIDLFAHLDVLGLTVLDSKRSPTSLLLQRLGDPEAMEKADSSKENSNERASEKAEAGRVSRTSRRQKLEEPSTRNSKRDLHYNEIQDSQFVSDGIINFVFNQYSEDLRRKEIHDAILVDTDTAFLLSHGYTTEALQLCSNHSDFPPEQL